MIGLGAAALLTIYLMVDRPNFPFPWASVTDSEASLRAGPWIAFGACFVGALAAWRELHPEGSYLAALRTLRPIGDTSTRQTNTRQPRFRTCPECAENVRGEAKVCRYCGHRFDSDSGIDSAPV